MLIVAGKTYYAVPKVLEPIANGFKTYHYNPDFVKSLNPKTKVLFLEEKDFFLLKKRCLNVLKNNPNFKMKYSLMALVIEGAIDEIRKWGMSKDFLKPIEDVAEIIAENPSFIKEEIPSITYKNLLEKTLLSVELAKRSGNSSKFFLKKLITVSILSIINIKSSVLSEDILKAHQHLNERGNGSGPMGLKKEYIHPISKVLQVGFLLHSHKVVGRMIVPEDHFEIYDRQLLIIASGI